MTIYPQILNRTGSILACALLLGACGGGGGNGDSGTEEAAGEGPDDDQTALVTAEAGSGGAISPGSREAEIGETIEFTVKPDSDYSIDDVSGCDGSLSGQTFTTGDIDGDCTVTAGFVRNHSIGGTIEGQVFSSAPVVLTSEQAGAIELTDEGSFTLPDGVADGSRYELRVDREHTASHIDCQMTNADGVISGSEVDDILIRCFRLGGPSRLTGHSGTYVVWTPDDDHHNNVDWDVSGAYLTPLSSAHGDLLDGARVNVSVPADPNDYEFTVEAGFETNGNAIHLSRSAHSYASGSYIEDVEEPRIAHGNICSDTDQELGWTYTPLRQFGPLANRLFAIGDGCYATRELRFHIPDLLETKEEGGWIGDSLDTDFRDWVAAAADPDKTAVYFLLAHQDSDDLLFISLDLARESVSYANIHPPPYPSAEATKSNWSSVLLPDGVVLARRIYTGEQVFDQHEDIEKIDIQLLKISYNGAITGAKVVQTSDIQNEGFYRSRIPQLANHTGPWLERFNDDVILNIGRETFESYEGPPVHPFSRLAFSGEDLELLDAFQIQADDYDLGSGMFDAAIRGWIHSLPPIQSSDQDWRPSKILKKREDDGDQTTWLLGEARGSLREGLETIEIPWTRVEAADFGGGLQQVIGGGEVPRITNRNDDADERWIFASGSFKRLPDTPRTDGQICGGTAVYEHMTTDCVFRSIHGFDGAGQLAVGTITFEDRDVGLDQVRALGEHGQPAELPPNRAIVSTKRPENADNPGISRRLTLDDDLTHSGCVVDASPQKKEPNIPATTVREDVAEVVRATAPETIEQTDYHVSHGHGDVKAFPHEGRRQPVLCSDYEVSMDRRVRVTGSLEIIRPGGTTLTYEVKTILEEPENGSLCIGCRGGSSAVEYTPDQGFTGHDEFEVLVRGDTGEQRVRYIMEVF